VPYVEVAVGLWREAGDDPASCALQVSCQHCRTVGDAHDAAVTEVHGGVHLGHRTHDVNFTVKALVVGQDLLVPAVAVSPVWLSQNTGNKQKKLC